MIDTSANSSFSRELPGLQLAVDSTSLGLFKVCPRKYYYAVVLGWQPLALSVHLTFGLLMHGARERYDHAKAAGLGHNDALDAALAWGLCETWVKELGRPWASGDDYKNRVTFLRTLVWYLDEYGENDLLETVILSDGKPAVERSFRFDSGFCSSATGEPWLLCGHLDRIATLNGTAYIVDLKTSKHQLNAGFFKGFNPDNQMSMYSLAGRVAFHQPVEGLIIDGVQVAINFSRFERGLVTRDSASLDEWHRDTGRWLRRMEQAAVDEEWEANDKACHIYSRGDGTGGCEFREICSRSPQTRETWLRAGFSKRVWDPLVTRGDV